MADPRVRRAQEKCAELAFEQLPAFLRTSSIEVLCGLAVLILGILAGGLIGSALVGIGVLLVTWTTATGVAASAATSTARASHEARLDEIAQRLVMIDAQFEAALAHEDPALREALAAEAQRSLAYALSDIGVQPAAAEEPEVLVAELAPPASNGAAGGDKPAPVGSETAAIG